MLQGGLFMSYKLIIVDSIFSSIVSTSLLLSNIWITQRVHQSNLLNIMHSIIIGSLITTLWINITVNYLLGWGWNISSSSYTIPSFNGITDRKSPTSCTLSLCFNGSIETPINSFKWFFSIKNLFYLFYLFYLWSIHLI